MTTSPTLARQAHRWDILAARCREGADALRALPPALGGTASALIRSRLDERAEALAGLAQFCSETATLLRALAV